MALPQLSERAVKIVVILFSLTGLIVLSIIAVLTEVDTIHIWEAEYHIGERVSIEGMVIGSNPSRSGSSWLLIMEENSTMEIFIENGKGDLEPGSIVSAEGDITSMDGEPVLTVQNQGDIQIQKSPTISNYQGGSISGEFHFINCIVQSSRHIEWDYQEVIVIPMESSSSDGIPVLLNMRMVDIDLRPGDVLNVTGLFTEERTALTYGERSCKILARAEPITTSLLRLVTDMRVSPSLAPLEPFDIEGYLRYPSSGKTIYISEMIEGGEISIRARLPEPRSDLERGDLVRLVNCSMAWDSEGMRYEIVPEWCELLEIHGPWGLNLDAMDNGILDFLDCMVVVSGTVSRTDNRTSISKGEVSLEIRSYDGPIDREETEVLGRLAYDQMLNIIYLEPEAGGL